MSDTPVPETREQRVERIYAQAEQSLEGVKARRVRRGPEVLIGVTVLLALAVGTVAAVDLRRLMTPSGAALAWTGAAVFGDCTAYERLSVAAPGAPADDRSSAERCQDLQAATARDRDDSSSVGIELLSVRQDRDSAQAQVRVTGPDGVADVRLELVEVSDGWAVVRTAPTCRAVGCA
ncbi:MAG: hypothetical protein JWN08_1616 [Frankiales bacterium]|nr:hypothetical protein [Frankiales bacterium]